MDVLIELGLIFVVTLIVTAIMRLLKQPLIIGYIVSGLLLGPLFLDVITSVDELTAFAHIGIVLLLFIVGLHLNPQVIKEVGRVSLITGVGQVLFTSIFGYLICRLLGFGLLTSAYIAVAITFSSTIIIMKMLSDKGDLNTLYGKISVGFLIVQDIIAMIILLVISSIPAGFDPVVFFFEVVLLATGLILAVLLISGTVLKRLTNIVAKSQEFLLLFSVGWGVILSAIFYSLNFSMEIGALLAGISFSYSPYRYEISSRMKPLRDFFIVLFFIMLGSQMTFTNIGAYVPIIIILSLFILIGNPLIVIILMGAMKYTRRTGFLAGLTVAQISEFSLILIALGVRVGHLDNEILSLVTIIGLITIAGSVYMIMYANKIYLRISKFLLPFERKTKKVDEHKHHDEHAHDIILFGCDRMGYYLIESFKKLKSKFLVIDYNPTTITQLVKEGVDCRYGDAADTELLYELNLKEVKMVYSTVADTETNILIINTIKKHNEKAILIVVSHHIDEAMALYDAGATYVVMPHFLGGGHASSMIEQHGLRLDKFLEEKVRHIEHLRARREKGHEHPTYHKE